jgi:gas vesicle protein
MSMSYAGKDPRTRRNDASTATAATAASSRGRRAKAGERTLERELIISSRGVRRPAPVPDTRPSDDGELDWQHIALFAAGALLGAIVGGGAALLFAPESGERTRHNLARRGRHLRGRAADAWDDLRHELSYATRRGRRTLSRKVNRALRDRRRQRELREDVLADD